MIEFMFVVAMFVAMRCVLKSGDQMVIDMSKEELEQYKLDFAKRGELI